MPEMSENPALNPTREWTDSPEVRADLHSITKKASAERLAVLRRLLDGPIHGATAEEEQLASFFNRASEAFGFVAMIDITHGRCTWFRVLVISWSRCSHLDIDSSASRDRSPSFATVRDLPDRHTA